MASHSPYKELYFTSLNGSTDIVLFVGEEDKQPVTAIGLASLDSSKYNLIKHINSSDLVVLLQTTQFVVYLINHMKTDLPLPALVETAYSVCSLQDRSDSLVREKFTPSKEEREAYLSASEPTQQQLEKAIKTIQYYAYDIFTASPVQEYMERKGFESVIINNFLRQQPRTSK